MFSRFSPKPLIAFAIFSAVRSPRFFSPETPFSPPPECLPFPFDFFLPPPPKIKRKIPRLIINLQPLRLNRRLKIKKLKLKLKIERRK
jgi:hypothetical protein